MKKFSTSYDRILKVAVSALLITTVPPLWADSPNEEAIQKRTDLMKEMKDHTKSIKKILDGDTDVGTLQVHTAGIAHLTQTLSTDLKTLFPVGSNQGDSQAKESIWKNWTEFEKVAQSAATKGAALHQINDGGNSDAIVSAYKEMGDACKACHKDYRTDK